MLTPIGCGFVAAGCTLVALGGLYALTNWLRRRPWADVLDNIEPPHVVMPMRCICASRMGWCGCAVDGIRNPRGAGRGRS